MNNLKTLLSIALFSFIFLASCNKKETAEKDFQTSLQNIADSIYQSFNTEWGIDNAGIHFYISGLSGSFMASSNITPKPSPDSHFRVASITKTFTAASIMLLHQQGELNINDTITSYLPNTSNFDIPNKNIITIKQLLQHRSGVFDVSNNDIPATVSAPYAGMKYEDYIRNQNDLHSFTFEEMIGVNAEHQLSTALPDDGFYYSNTGYNILGRIIEEVSGISYSEFIAEKFTIPLGLTGTYSPWQGSEVEMQTPYINSYFYMVGETPIETSQNNVSIHVAEGNIVSTPEDITKWIKLLLTGNAGINSSNVALMKEMEIADEGHGLYGLGLIYDDLGYGHNGIHQSYVSSTRYNPNNGISILVSANFIRFDPAVGQESIFELAYALRDAMHVVVEEYQK
ncbi:serine hydrolase domain-containing protein [Brumimicrobium mesophilum]|uniref:serine hydrolase domain-containing protein n=1 Tax=Brumimicrobium mesophilum TaxID=392717 RepID=UPI000D142E9B|nr:serine hydrolase domain-containing protein [Brumimicrobium mesophilum]